MKVIVIAFYAEGDTHVFSFIKKKRGNTIFPHSVYNKISSVFAGPLNYLEFEVFCGNIILYKDK